MFEYSPWCELANSIVLKAVDDWQRASYSMWKNRGSTEAQMERHRQAKRVKTECERFFRSDWFSTLCDLDGESILRQLNARFDRRIKAKISRMMR